MKTRIALASVINWIAGSLAASLIMVVHSDKFGPVEIVNIISVTVLALFMAFMIPTIILSAILVPVILVLVAKVTRNGLVLPLIGIFLGCSFGYLTYVWKFSKVEISESWLIALMVAGLITGIVSSIAILLWKNDDVRINEKPRCDAGLTK